MVATEDPKKLIKTAQAAYQRGEFQTAAQAFAQATAAYQAHGQAVEAAEAANNCCVAYLQAEDGAAALAAVEGTPAVFAAAGDLRRQGMALGNRAAALDMLERLEEAAEAYQQSADVLKQAGENDLRLHAMQALSAMQLRTGRRFQALATMQAGLEDIPHPNPKQRLLKRLLKVPFEMMNKR